MPTVVAGDIGGTSSRFMLYAVPSEHVEHIQGTSVPGTLVFQKTYANEDVAAFGDQLSSFLEDAGTHEPPQAACFAVAGPVHRNTVTMTNRNWIIEGSELEQRFNIAAVRLVNDFVAAGYGLLTLDVETECVTLQEGDRVACDPIACIGSGTGLGETFLTCPVSGGLYDAWPTEGGHAEFSPRNDLEYELAKHIKKAHNTSRVSVERVVSGKGLVNIYDFLSQKFPERVDKPVDDAIKIAGDQKGRIISLNSNVPGSLCEQVMDIWATHYGCEAGAMGLRVIPTGGLFLAGGMTPKNLRWIQEKDGPFMKAFHDKGRVSALLAAIPIYAVLGEDIGLRGAHFVAFREYQLEHEAEIKRQKVKKIAAFSATAVGSIAALSAVAGAILARAYSSRK